MVRDVGCVTWKLPRSLTLMGSANFHLLLFVALLLFTPAVGASSPRRGKPRSRRVLAGNANATSSVNATASLSEDAEVLLQFKAAITTDPFNVTRYWKPIGKRQIVNPCRPWIGITCTRRRVTAINLHNRSLAGALPAALGRLAALQTLNLSLNHFSGSIPSFQASNASLQILDLAGNNLTGTIPESLVSSIALQRIDLSENRLHGVVPLTQSLANLTFLHLQNNLLDGDFITKLGAFPTLEDVDLRNNQLSGRIPDTIGALPLRTGLILGKNRFNGSIPDELGELALVKRIDLSENRFSGAIPDRIKNCISLTELNIAGNDLSGAFSVPNGTLPALTILNVSHNTLNGSLPTLNHLGNLILFDASFNGFSGEVAPTFVTFPALQSLNVSSNRLSGEVPFFTPHDNVTARSFLNNSALCGEVLGVKCSRDHGGVATSTIVYITLGSVAAVLALTVIAFFCTRRMCKGGWNKGSKHSAQVSDELRLKLTAEEILTATNGFNPATHIGGGKLGEVYRGVLPGDTTVAVKRLAIAKEGAELDKALEKELEVLGHTRHRSLVKVLGYCSSTAETRAIVMEYMPNGSLAGLLHAPQNEDSVNRAFDWTVRFKIALEVAEGLKYLHAESRFSPVVHGDVKPSNVLFDANMGAKVADFGLKRVLVEQGFRPSSSPSTATTAVHGYTPAEVAASGVPSMKGDVYSFGIIMLEMFTGRDPNRLEFGQTLPQWVRATVANSKALQHVLDPVLMPDLPIHQQKMAMLLGVALLCTRSEPQDRPQMIDVYKMLVHIRSKSNETSRRKGLMISSGRRSTSSAARRSGAMELAVQHQPLPHTPSLSDWTPPSEV